MPNLALSRYIGGLLFPSPPFTCNVFQSDFQRYWNLVLLLFILYVIVFTPVQVEGQGTGCVRLGMSWGFGLGLGLGCFEDDDVKDE